MFCEKCGNKNKEGARFCEFCGAPLSATPQQINPQLVETVQTGVTQVPTKKKTEKAQKKSGTPGNRIVLMGGLIALVIMCLVTGILIFVGLKNRKNNEPVNTDGSYYKAFDESDVIFPEDGEAYVDKQLLITAEDDVSVEELQKTFKSYGGAIVGYNTITNTYQVEFAKKSGDKLLELIDEIQDESGIKSVSLNYVYYNESLLGSSTSLDSSLMGIANSDYDESLLGDLQVALIGTTTGDSGISSILADAKIIDVAYAERELVSLYGWECDFANKADEGCELFEIASNLVPTYDAEKDQMMVDLNKNAADFINMMHDAEYNFMILSSAQKDEPAFIGGIADERAMEQILCVGSSADAGNVPGADIFAEGDSPEALEYATTIAVVTWLNNLEMSGETLKDVLANSFVDPIGDGLPGVLNAEISAEVSRRLREMVASATDADFEITAEDILKIVDEVKVEWGLVSEEEPAPEPEAATETDAPQDFSAEDDRFRGFFENEYATFADELLITQNGIEAKYAYVDMDGDGTYELLIGDDYGIFAIVSEAGGAYQISKVNGWLRQYGAESSEYIGNGCVVTDLNLGNNYGGESGVKILWKYNGAIGQAGVVARLSDSWATDTPSDELPQNCWDLYVVNDEGNTIYDDEAVKSDPNYTYSHDDYGEYYNRDTEQYENDCSIAFYSLVDSHRGSDTLDSYTWTNVSDFN